MDAGALVAHTSGAHILVPPTWGTDAVEAQVSGGEVWGGGQVELFVRSGSRGPFWIFLLQSSFLCAGKSPKGCLGGPERVGDPGSHALDPTQFLSSSLCSSA